MGEGSHIRKDCGLNWDEICNGLGHSTPQSASGWHQLDAYRCVLVSDNVEMASRLVNLKMIQVKGVGWL